MLIIISSWRVIGDLINYMRVLLRILPVSNSVNWHLKKYDDISREIAESNSMEQNILIETEKVWEFTMQKQNTNNGFFWRKQQKV